MRILIVDDSSVDRKRLEKPLLNLGYEVVSVDNINSALELIKSKPKKPNFQFVITDWVMQGKDDGPTLCREVRKLNLPFYTYIILLTSLEGTQSLVIGLEAGADDFINKPFHNEVLRARIHAGERLLEMEKKLRDHKEKLEHENTKAGMIQNSLLPLYPSTKQGINFDGLAFTSVLASGDIFNFFEIDDHTVGFYSIDVAGHGIVAAMLSFAISRILTTVLDKFSPFNSGIINQVKSTSYIIEGLNSQFQTDETQINDSFFTMIYGVIDTHSHKIELCQAGHPNPIYLPNQGDAHFIGKPSLPVGVIPDTKFEPFYLDYSPKDRLFLYSDGITECFNSHEEMFGSDRLLQFINDSRELPLNEVISRLDKTLKSWRGSDTFEDDISLLALEIP